MANSCYFEMKIAGKKENVQELVEMIQHTGRFKENGLGRVFSFDTNDFESDMPNSPFVSVVCYGDCAWSLESALLEYKGRNPSLESETKRLGLVVEAYSSEPGCRFQEHILINQGEMISSECVDYKEYWIEGMSKEAISDLLKKINLSKEELMDNLNDNGDYCVGGFGEDFGDFKNLFSYLSSELEHSSPTNNLDDLISAASQKANNNVSDKPLTKDLSPVLE